MNALKITIIIPVYNLEDYISNCIESIINQDYENLEIIIVDDGSTDGSWDKILRYQQIDNRIIAIQQKNGGAGKARNTALQRVTGDLVTFVDGDDMLSKETLRDLCIWFEKDKELDWLEFSVIRVMKNGERQSNPIDYSCFTPQKDTTFYKKDFIELIQNKKLSELCCACLYRWSSIWNIRFPENEYYEDSFYFTDIIVQTNKGGVSTQGKYLYVERPGSSQLSELNKKRLLSKVKCGIERLNKFSLIFPQYLDYYTQMASDLYYFVKIQAAKKIEGADEIFQKIRKKLDYPLRKNWVMDLKYYVYKYIGYDNIKHIYNLVNKK
ncbi:glycosyltransferase family A protein [Barnesiella viscericola]|uniref:glycosyltransferase family A protein n=1 Tax=Barnesiella viscericola TaxID=397865 RepID=UPI002356A9CB|nr:glycosyltransferase family 2 protein [Barnesiella viscericola]